MFKPIQKEGNSSASSDGSCVLVSSQRMEPPAVQFPVPISERTTSGNSMVSLSSSSSHNNSNNVAVSVRPSPIKCTAGNASGNPMLANLTMTIRACSASGNPLPRSPQTAFERTTQLAPNAGTANVATTSTNVANNASNTITNPTTTAATVINTATATNKPSLSVAAPTRCLSCQQRAESLLTPTESSNTNIELILSNRLPQKSMWCMDIPVVASAITSSQRNVHNIDFAHRNMPEWSTSYSIDMYDYFNIIEDEFRPDHQYLHRQSAINAEQRAYLINAMVGLIFF